MKRLLKILAVAAIAVAAAIACVLVGCNNGGGESSADYTFTIVYKGGDKDGKAVNGQTDGNYATDEEYAAGKEGTKVPTQLCIGTNCKPLTDQGIFFGADGKLTLSQTQVNQIFKSDTDVTQFDFHVTNVKGYKNDCSVSVNGKGAYKVEVVLAA